MKSDEEVLLERARNLAASCARSGVKDYQLGQVLAHLKRHQDVAATRRLLSELKQSPFGRRTRSAEEQFSALEANVGTALARVPSWRQAAALVGWAKRLLRVSGRS
ncbi:MAG: hypothetical protein D6696_00145 [Acidobacteria bacterium]|nr:MAG: hypothetical protein D6696_00145 [Acidobacteriota bacterium]